MRNRSLSIYVVDDDPSVRDAYSRLLSSARMTPTAFNSVEALLANDLSHDPDCIIADIRMPGASGLELPGLLTRSVPVIYVTAHDNPETRETARRAGAAGYFRKPVDSQALIDAITWATGQQAGA